jgi:hypothetical protein
VPTSEPTVSFADLPTADLVVDRLYLPGSANHAGDDPIAQLVPVGNQGGFRAKGSIDRGTVRLLVLYSSTEEPDWPDSLDPQTGLFTYYGDNRSPGRELHDTSRGGNRLLRDMFSWTHDIPSQRRKVPPTLLFTKIAGRGRAVRFRGLLVPGAATLSADDDLQAIWRSTRGHRFQNYRARFTVLDVPVVTRSWINQIIAGDPHGDVSPAAWRRWIDGRAYTPLVAPATTTIRTTAEQLPTTAEGKAILETIHGWFTHNSHGFEACALELWRMIAPNTGNADLTRPSRDGGRDAIGAYLIGPPADQLAIEFALEAKC